MHSHETRLPLPLPAIASGAGRGWAIGAGTRQPLPGARTEVEILGPEVKAEPLPLCNALGAVEPVAGGGVRSGLAQAAPTSYA